MFNRRAYDRAWAEAHPERVKDKNQRYREKARQEVLTYYSFTNPPSCVRCGNNDIDVLCIDHINGGGNRQREQLRIHGGVGFHQWLRKSNYPEGYQVLCWNCNIKKRIQEGC